MEATTSPTAETRGIALTTLDYIHAMRPDTDPSVILQLNRIADLLAGGAE